MKRIEQLDGIRGIAILMVLIWHYLHLPSVVEPGSLAHYFKQSSSLTWSGVDLFFVLSGFLITGSLIDHRGEENSLRIFYVRRFCRIFPLYYLLLGLYVGMTFTPLFSSVEFHWLFSDPLPLWSYATFCQNVVMGLRSDFGPNWLGITWSLAVEEQFYLLIPLLILALPRRVAVGFFVLAALAAPLLRAVLPGFHEYVSTPWRADSLLSGSLLALLIRWQRFAPSIRLNRLILPSILAAFLAGAAVLTIRPEAFGVFDHLWLAGLYSTLVLIGFVGDESLLGRPLRAPILVWFGKLSYGIYMFHQAVNGLLHATFRGAGPTINNPVDFGITLAAFVLTLILAGLSYRYFETPFLRLGHRLRYSTTT